MKILVVDDEVLARQRLVALIEEIGQPYQLAGEAANGEEALQKFNQIGADLVLMDIRMPGMDGLEAARQMAESDHPPAVIFTTAYEEHALQAFESAAQDYLLKPVRRVRLLAALQRSQRLTRSQLAATASTETEVPQLHASYRGGLKSIPLDEVIYLRADSKYVMARHAEGELLLEESLKGLQQRFGDLLLRIHRNALVVRRHLSGLEKGRDGIPRVVMRGCEETLEVSRRHLPEVRRVLRGQD
ncbi:MAG: LytTR family DNA-binding domain-containing protein [Candidatus Thiodiazotropha sp.]|nr:LytTR family DNA-binding domain-containing protein [Candidatus Thiodiazotropha sp.]MCU7803448.1 LytTR family DNA-binding domain-containing protein [Candidatus Thiodiazotropha sp. (ex Lucinoma borealis)]MCU7841871.1 LytTR family DNA-binding domain-containing protein [Candidatus Thiodiazotropha sp. (ex Troendleina suluensis)]MCU7885163.1 LytTR family DNA-binding domain-containing protein [Candidatus Thiodiazotropha sp. (ex Lucinoma annulata)]MCM8885202.1 LytTR family DNA-binding domain-contain